MPRNSKENSEYIVLCIRNDGAYYRACLAIARSEANSTVLALQWLSQVTDKARELRQQFNETFTVSELLNAAILLHDEFIEHVKEVDNG